MFQQHLPLSLPPVDTCPAQSASPCPQLPLSVDTCLDNCPPAVPTSLDAPLCCTINACPAPVACGSNQEQQGTSFPMQHACSPVEPCTLEVVGTCVDTLPMQPPASPVQPICPQGAITCEPCPDRCFVPQVGPCAVPSTSCLEPGVPQSAVAPGDSSCPRQAPCRPQSRTAAIVEQCLARCEKWLRGKK